MLYLSLTVAVYCTLFTLLYKKYLSSAHTPLRSDTSRNIFSAILIISIIFRFIIAMHTSGYGSDMNCWRAWADRAYHLGPAAFYSEDVFCDYPPGYIYVLTLLGFFRHIFPTVSETLEVLLLKIPAIISDCITIVLIYKTAKHFHSSSFSVILSVLFAFCPGIWINSSVWGQVDAVFTLTILLSLSALIDNQYYKSAFWFAVAVLFKPQALLFTPLYLLAVKEKKAEICLGKKFLYSVLIGIGTFLLFSLPFIIRKEPCFIFSLYFKTLASYKYASLNAFNLFTLIGANGIPLDSVFAGLTYGTWGVIGILTALSAGILLFLRGKDKSKYFYCGALIIFGIFMFGTKMHERYLFPALPLFFFAYIYKKDRRILFLAAGVSLLHFMNVGYLYLLSLRGTYYAMAPDKTASVLSLLHLLAYVYAAYLGFSLYAGIKPRQYYLKPENNKITKKDRFIILIVTGIYTIIAFINLGNTAAPTTAATPDNIADLGAQKEITSVSVYKGIGDCSIYFEFSDDGTAWTIPLVFEGGECFKWVNYPLSITSRYIRVRFTGQADSIYEAAFYDAAGNQLPLSSESPLFDEQDLCEKDATYKNSTYFDEIYHARTAYEHIMYIPHYETTHPPLGKLIIGLGIRLFGMNPFGWRFMGTLAGILMLPLMYLFAKKIFKSSFLALTAMLLLAFDFMHFSQTRIATIDSYPVLFIMLAYYFMYLFYADCETLSLKKLCLYLCLSGVSFGLAIASKWIGFYAGMGLCLLFFVALYRRIKAKNAKEFIICAFCILFFIAIPFIIYYISYIPIHIADGAESYWTNFVNYQKHMFLYHSDLEATHPFSSQWYTWPFVLRPIWYYGNAMLSESGFVSSIVGMGNPIIWWASFAAILSLLVYILYKRLQKRSCHSSLFIASGYLSQLVPWMIISRVVFIYHYFASLPFAILALVYFFKKLRMHYVWGTKAIYVFMIISGLLFIAFYPILSGAEIPRTYMLSFLKWFDTWTIGY